MRTRHLTQQCFWHREKGLRMKKAIAYYRVSTHRQGMSGLGLEAQTKAVTDFAQANGYSIDGEYVEVKTGKKNRRLELRKALRECKRKTATLLVAALDRMSRKVHFISNLMESGVRFIPIDVPSGEKFMMHIKAAVAEHEGEEISKRTKLALQAAKARGVHLGTFGSNVLSKLNREMSYRFARKMRPTITKLKHAGFTTIRAITKELNRQHVPTYRNNGSKWHVSTVHKIIHINKKS